jgi:heme/copper-type cytochrome/quinol oxidase subunit 2
MLQIILLLVVAGVAAYFIATSRKSKVEEVSKTTAPKNPTFDPVVHAPVPVEEIIVDANPIASVQQIEELKEAKKVVKKSAPKKKATK